MMRNIFRIYWALLISAFVPLVSFAQNKLGNPTPGIGTLSDFIDILIQLMWLIVMPALVVLIIYAGFVIVTAQGDKKKLELGKKILLWTLVGALIIVGAKLIKEAVIGTLSPFNAAI